MISKKVFTADGVNKRFLSDFIIQSEQFARPYAYIYDNTLNPNGSEDVLQNIGLPWAFPTNLYKRGTDAPNSAFDLLTIDKWDLVDNSILTYAIPLSPTHVWIEVATTPEEFGETLTAPSVERAETAATQASASAVAAALSETNADSDAAQVALDLIDTTQDSLDTAADVVITNGDVVITNGDVVITNGDVVITNADALLTAQDSLDTAADLVLTNADALASSNSASAALASETAAGISESNSAASASAALISENNAADSAIAAGEVGQIIEFAGTVAPLGYLAMDASEISQITYASLFSVIGTTWDTTGGVAAPAVGNFRIPPSDIGNLGLYRRGVGSTNGAVGTYQADVFKSHSHTLNMYGNVASLGTQPAASSSTFSGARASNLTGDATETRPRSITVLLCIKY